MKRRKAIELGLKIYQPDKPCARGHNSGRYSSTGTCVECVKLQTENIKRGSHLTVVTYSIPNQYKEYMDAIYESIIIQSKIDLQKSITNTIFKVVNQ